MYACARVKHEGKVLQLHQCHGGQLDYPAKPVSPLVVAVFSVFFFFTPQLCSFRFIRGKR